MAANTGFTQPTNVAPKTRVGVLVDNYPFSFRGDDERMQGFAYELMREIELVMGLQFERIEGTTKEINGAFEAGQIDLLQSLARTPERERTIEFSVPYLHMTGQIFMRKDGVTIQSLADLKGRKVLVHRGSLGESLLLQAGLQESITYVESVEQAFIRLNRGEADATLATRLTGLSLAHRLGLTQVRVLDLEIPGFQVNYCVAAQKGDHATLARVNEGMALLVRTGKFDVLYKKWFGFVTPNGYTTEQVLLAVSVGLTLALVVAIWAVLRQRTLLAQIASQAEILQRSEASLAAAQAQAHLGSWEMDLASEKITWSAEMFRLHYHDLSHPVPKFAEFLALVHPDDIERIQNVKARILEINSAVGREYRTNPTLGPVRYLSATYRVICDAAGNQCKVVGTTLDITERKLSELARERSLSLMLSTLESTADGILVVNSEGKIETFNRVFARMWRLPNDVLASKDDARALQCVLDQLSAPQTFIDKVSHLYKHPEEESFDNLEFKDGRVFERYSRPQFVNGQVVGRVWSFRDITKRKQGEAALEDSREQLRALTARLETLREEERIRISREIHDELGQKLTGLKMDLHWLENRLPQIGDEKLRTALEEKIITATTTADETMVTVQRIAAELRPAMLDSLGLITTLRYEAKQFEGRTNIPVTMSLPAGAVNLNSAVATTAYRIFQEVLTNVARHAQATKVQVMLEVSDGKLRLQVEDNGVGVSSEDLLNPRSLGLLGMKERAAMLNGSVRVEGAPGQGTIVRLEISVENPAASDKQSQG